MKTNVTLLLTAATASASSLFDPVPTESMRELAADRPDVTESPITVDAGHLQIEASLFDWRRDGRDDTFTLMSTNLKFGITDHIDLQFVNGSYVEYVGIIGEHFYAPAISGGLTYAIHENLVLDIGTQIGLNRHAEDLALFSGFTVRY